MSFEVIDIVFALLVVIAAIRGAFRGFVTEVGSMAALILGFAAAIAFYKPVALLLDKQFGPSMWNQLIAFLILFLLGYLLVKLVQRMLQNIIDIIREYLFTSAPPQLKRAQSAMIKIRSAE